MPRVVPTGAPARSLPVVKEPAHQVEAQGHVALVDVFITSCFKLMQHGLGLGELRIAVRRVGHGGLRVGHRRVVLGQEGPG